MKVVAAIYVLEKVVDKSKGIEYRCINIVGNNTFGFTSLVLCYGSNEYTIRFQVTSNRLFDKFDGVLGSPFLVEQKALLNFSRIYYDYLEKLLLQNREQKQLFDENLGENLLLMSIEKGKLKVANSLVEVNNNGEIPVVILNEDDQTLKINSGEISVCNVETEELIIKQSEIHIRDQHIKQEEKDSIWKI